MTLDFNKQRINPWTYGKKTVSQEKSVWKKR